MLLMYNTSDDAAASVSEVYSADMVIDFKELWGEEDLPESLVGKNPVCGVIFSLAGIESYSQEDSDIYYETVYFFTRNIEDCYKIINELFDKGKVDLQKYKGIILLNPKTDEIEGACLNLS